MKNFLLSIFLIALASLLLQLFLPWWIIAVVSFAVAYFIKQNSLLAFLSAFIAVFLLWIVYAYLLSSANENILVTKVAELMKIDKMLPYVLIGILYGALAWISVKYFTKRKSFQSFLISFLLFSAVMYSYNLFSDDLISIIIKATNIATPTGKICGIYIITGIIGGLVSGFGALTGSLASKLK